MFFSHANSFVLLDLTHQENPKDFSYFRWEIFFPTLYVLALEGNNYLEPRHKFFSVGRMFIYSLVINTFFFYNLRNKCEFFLCVKWVIIIHKEFRTFETNKELGFPVRNWPKFYETCTDQARIFEKVKEVLSSE